MSDDILFNPKLSLSVIDMNGKVVAGFNSLSEKTLYLKSLTSGVYSIVVRSSNLIIATKFFITN